jgi:hypothetical protein
VVRDPFAHCADKQNPTKEQAVGDALDQVRGGGYWVEPGTEREEFVPFGSERAEQVEAALRGDALDAVAKCAQRRADLLAQADQATKQLAEACTNALREHSKIEVAGAAGVSFQAMYQLIGRHKQ